MEQYPQHNDYKEREQDRHRRLTDTLSFKLTAVEEQVASLQASDVEIHRLLTELLTQQAIEKANKDFVNKILAPLGTIVITCLGILLGHFIPTLIGKR